ncbi:transcription factor IIIB 90 kDa subunit [Microplitis mediator]|uniref:transcription factor IIIB 90 kDa subunit n=1 Tax=Microplitis mediator TaxID=375433 RepID=UPI0025565008|nr:transcription factor IIIB 90 kDa subunit [Microplitis mediator]
MSSLTKCRSCGSNDIETDPARGDAVCTSCGVVFEDQLIVSETTFEETSSGNMMVVGQFVANDSTGVASGFGAGYRINSKESHEITIQNARKGITHLCQQLHLKPYNIEMSVNFYKMALYRNLTRGRKQAHNHAACVYITCRTEKTSHLLIDISDVLQIDVYELGRTYLKFIKAFSLTMPSMDPCLYIIRYASKLDFGSKTHEVSTTASRLVTRMKRDSIHSGRRPSGLCGAALLIAARLHEFNRTPSDIIKIVKVHESTLRKRLIEFGDTPSSALTLDEFMTVDLEEEQDPPAFKATRKKDRERLQKLENIDEEFDDLQNEIDRQLSQSQISKKRPRELSCSEDIETDRFIQENTLNIIQNCLEDNSDGKSKSDQVVELGPDIASMGLPSSFNDSRSSKESSDKINKFNNGSGEIDLNGLDDDELDGYILSETEAGKKTDMWNSVNAEYLELQKEKEEKRLKAQEEGKPEKKKRRTGNKKKQSGPANSTGEAIEKILQEKRISLKINYDVLETLKVSKNDTQKNNKSDNNFDISRNRFNSVSENEDGDKDDKSMVDMRIDEDRDEEVEAEAEEEVEDEEEDMGDDDDENMSVRNILKEHSKDDEFDGFGYDYEDEEY